MQNPLPDKSVAARAAPFWLRALKLPLRVARSALLNPARRQFQRHRDRRETVALARELQTRTPALDTDRPILVVMHPKLHPRLNDVQVQWLQRNFPELTGLMLYRLLPVDSKTVQSSGAVVFWVQDPVEHLSREAWHQCLAIEALCRDAGVPIINRPSRYRRVDRLEASCRLRDAGLRTPAVEVIGRWDKFRREAAGFAYPFVIRNRFGQAGDLFRIDAPDDLDDPRLATLRDPVRVDWLDVADPGAGIYRKYRTFVIGERVIPHHLQITRNWVTRGSGRLKDKQAIAEELEFIRGRSPCESAFLKASRNFGLEVLAYDWGYCSDGELVVWEANPYPFVRFSGPEGQTLYRADAIHRTYAALTELYLTAAGLPVPERISDLASLEPDRFAVAVSSVQPVY